MLLSTVCFYSPERLIDNRCDSGLVLVVCLMSFLCFWTLFCQLGNTLTDSPGTAALSYQPAISPLSFASVHSSGGGVKPWNHFFNEALDFLFSRATSKCCFWRVSHRSHRSRRSDGVFLDALQKRSVLRCSSCVCDSHKPSHTVRIASLEPRLFAWTQL